MGPQTRRLDSHGPLVVVYGVGVLPLLIVGERQIVVGPGVVRVVRQNCGEQSRHKRQMS